ncbi:MAG: acylase [Anaerolineae bacterium]|nr:acylase [Gemmatimonadaceae bacterium]
MTTAYVGLLRPVLVLAVGAVFAQQTSAGQAPTKEPAGQATRSQQPGRRPTEILWDRWGIPHIYAPTAEGAFRAFGWAQAHSHADLVLRLYGEARGRSAEYWGEGKQGGDEPSNLETDRFVRLMGIPARGREWHRKQSPAFQRYVEAFAAGFNAYARAHPDEIGDSVKIVLPVTAADVMAHIQRVIHFEFMLRPDANEGVVNRWRSAGSNAWAIAPSRSASGNAMLLANPHLLWSGFYTFYEAHVSAPGIDAYGVSLIGFPAVSIAFNDRLGWTHTVNTHDGRDLYELTLADSGYKWDGGVRAFNVVSDTIKVKQPDGTMRTERVSSKRSLHGPVISEKSGKAIAVRVAALDRANVLEQTWDMMRARNLAEYERALSRLQLPMFNAIYADRDGHILYVFNGTTPVRSRGDWPFWAGIVPGDTSSLLWTRQHSYASLPRVVDPPSGWVQNANDPPWYATFPLSPKLDADSFPAYMSPRGMALRPQRSAEMLSEATAKLSFDDVVRLKHDTHVEMADRVLDELVAMARESGSERAKRAASTLAAWDRKTDAASRGAPLFLEWAREMNRGSVRIFATPWNAANPLTTPKGLADATRAVVALDSAAAKLERDFASMDVPFGDVYRVKRDAIDLPSNGFSDPFGVFRATFYAPDGKGFRAVGGDSWYAVVEFGTPVRARALLGYGNASQKGSPHRTDQVELFSRKELREVWRSRKEVEGNLEKREVIRDR